MNQATELIELLRKFESGQISEDAVFDFVDEMSPWRTHSVVQINAYMKPFLKHFLRVCLWNELICIKDMDKALLNMKKRNKIKRGNGYWFTNEEDFQEIAEDVLDSAVNELNMKYRKNKDYKMQLAQLNEVSKVSARPDQYIHELWPNGFKFANYNVRPW